MQGKIIQAINWKQKSTPFQLFSINAALSKT